MSAQRAGANANRCCLSFNTLKTDALTFRDDIKQSLKNPGVQVSFCYAKSRQLLYRSDAAVAVDGQTDRDHIKYVTHNKDFYDAFVVVNEKAWNSQQEFLVCTSFPDDQEHEWTLDYFTCNFLVPNSGVKGGSWQINPLDKSIMSMLAVQASSTFQRFLNQHFVGRM